MSDPNPQLLITHFQTLLPLVVSSALKAVGAIVILLVGIWLSGKVHYLVSRAMARAPHFDDMLRSFFGSLARYMILTVTVLAVLSQFGIQTTSLVAVLGAAGLAVGLALQGTLSNLAAGVMLLVFRPFRIGHKVQVGGITGTVKDLSLFWTEILSEDGVQIIVPNGGIWGQPLRNYSTYPAPIAAGEVRFPLSETDNTDQILAVVKTAVDVHPKISKTDAPKILFDRNAEGVLSVVVSFKTPDGDPPTIRSDLLKGVRDTLSAKPGGQVL